MAFGANAPYGQYHQQAELIEITIKDYFFDNENPEGPDSNGAVCYSDQLLIEAKVTLTKTNSMDESNFFDKRDATSEIPTIFGMAREIYCGVP